MPDFTDDILDYLRARRGQLVATMTMINELTRRVKLRAESRRLRGKLLSDLSRLAKERKVIRYRRVTMVKKPPRSSQGMIRISELYA